MTIGWPITLTRGFGTVGWAMPPCMHWTIAPTCSRKPGMLHHLQGAVVERDAGWREADARRAVLQIDRCRRHLGRGRAVLERDAVRQRDAGGGLLGRGRVVDREGDRSLLQLDLVRRDGGRHLV